MTVRRFQLGANVFEVEVRGNELLVGVGKLVGAARPLLKARVKASEAEALAEMEKLIANHVAKGYVEVDVPADPELKRAKQRAENAASDEKMRQWNVEARKREDAARTKLLDCLYKPARNPALEARCGDDPEAWKVYADWLIDAGDPRGTIAQTFFRAGEAEALKACAELLMSGRVTLRHGFVYAASLGGEELHKIVKTLCHSGVACMLRVLCVGFGDRGNWTPVVDTIAESPIAGELVELVFDASDKLDRDPKHYSDDADDFYRSVTPLRFEGAPAWSKLTRLEKLTIDGPFNLRLDIASSSLREVTLRVPSVGVVDGLLGLRSSAPALERLAVFSPWLHDDLVAQLKRVFGKKLVTKGDSKPPARYGNVVE